MIHQIARKFLMPAVVIGFTLSSAHVLAQDVPTFAGISVSGALQVRFHTPGRGSPCPPAANYCLIGTITGTLSGFVEIDGERQAVVIDAQGRSTRASYGTFKIVTAEGELVGLNAGQTDPTTGVARPVLTVTGGTGIYRDVRGLIRIIDRDYEGALIVPNNQ